MRRLLSDTPERSRAHDLERVLRSTHSLLLYYTPDVKKERSLRILDLALTTAIADLQQLDDSSLVAPPMAQCTPEAL